MAFPSGVGMREIAFAVSTDGLKAGVYVVRVLPEFRCYRKGNSTTANCWEHRDGKCATDGIKKNTTTTSLAAKKKAQGSACRLHFSKRSAKPIREDAANNYSRLVCLYLLAS